MESAAWTSSLPQPLADMSASWESRFTIDQYQAVGVVACVAAAMIYFIKATTYDSKNFPLINPRPSLEILGKSRREEYTKKALSIVRKGVDKFPRRPFKVLAESGEITVLPSSWAHEIRNEPNLHFMKFVHAEFHADYPPFKPFASGTSDDELLQTVARKELTKYLSKVTKPLSDETKFAVQVNYGSPSCWQEFSLKPTLLDIVARISSRVFLGDQICRNGAWLEVTKSYTVTGFRAAEQLRLYPKWLRGIAQLYLPECRRLVDMINRSREIVGPVIQERRRLASQGRYHPAHTDAIDWFEEEAGGHPYDPAMCQMILSTVAIHTTSDLANETMIRLAQDQELVRELRKEIVDVLQSDGWKKTSLYNLKLLDSVLKESQRLAQPPVRMSRVATADVQLPDGSVLHKGERATVTTSGMVDPSTFDDPETFDPYRFAHMREQEGRQNQAHLVSTSASHLGFGHGIHACPGRFFASNELKIMFCHIIMKYDFKLPDGYTPKGRIVGSFRQSDPGSRMLFIARDPELDLDALEG